MDTSFEKTWASALDIIKENIGQTSFNTWFRSIKPIKFINNTYYFLAENEFEKGILESRHLPLITNAIAEVTGNNSSVRLILNEDELTETVEVIPAESIQTSQKPLP